MSTQQAALENLRVIRSLMEKAHIYRAISAPAALVGGVLSLMTAMLGAFLGLGKDGDLTHDEFLFLWMGVLVFTSALNVWLLCHEAKRRGHPVVSEGMRMALRALLPPLAAGGVLGIGLIIYLQNLTLAALIWIVCYGLALLGTASFSPRSLIRLGWMFLVSGLILFWIWASNGDVRLLPSDEAPASFAMGLTFGLLHIVYGIAVIFSKKPEPLPAE
jgi:hypothetical protein